MSHFASELAPFGNLQLKYCERCGSLWLRRCGSSRALCNSCAHIESATIAGDATFRQIWVRWRTEARA